MALPPRYDRCVSNNQVTLDPTVQRALRHGHTIDITTTGRASKQPRRIEIVFFNFGGRIYISGTPNPNHERAWLLNLEADPRMTFHLKRPVRDPDERRPIIEQVARAWNRDPETMQAYSPLIEVTIPGYEASPVA